jgi:ubiquinone/menaquinone biosynthesis C-methylase UbiE
MEEIRSYYNDKSESYDETFCGLYFKVYDAVTWRYLEPYVPTCSDAVVLDVGGGTGRWAIRMARKGCRVVLLDASEGMLKVAASKADGEGLQDRIATRRGDATKTDLPDEAFDMIFCEQTLFLFREPDALLKELHRTLKKKAYLIISAQNRYAQCLASLPENPTLDSVDNALKLLLLEKHNTMTATGKVNIYTWTPNEFSTMLEKNRFRVEKIIGKGVTMPLRISRDMFMKKEYPEDLFKKILEFELAMCEMQDTLALAGHLQAIAYKP